MASPCVAFDAIFLWTCVTIMTLVDPQYATSDVFYDDPSLAWNPGPWNENYLETYQQRNALDDCLETFRETVQLMNTFYACLPDHVVPVSICKNCSEPYRLAIESFAHMRLVRNCFNRSVITEAYGTLVYFWNSTFCNNCFLSPVTLDSHDTTPEFRPDVVEFMGNLTAVNECFAGNPGDSACANCRRLYEAVVQQYTTLWYRSRNTERQTLSHAYAVRGQVDVSPYVEFGPSEASQRMDIVLPRHAAVSLCVDAMSLMNGTRSDWESRGCQRQRSVSELIMPIVVVVVLLIMPVVFYLLAFCVSVRRNPYVEAQR